jgi:hypothetical protein
VATLFVNTEVYLVLANYRVTDLEFASPWTWRDRRTGRQAQNWSLRPRQLLFLQQVTG